MNIINRFTLKTLKKNKMRTLVSIVGIILSTAMFTAVTSIVFSLQQYELDLEVASSGEWEGRLNSLTKKQAQKFIESKNVEDATPVGVVGYADVKDSLNENKPYLCINSIQNNFTDLSTLRIAEGRMAEKSDELVLPKHLEENGGITYHVGDTITLEVGEREYEGEKYGQAVEYMPGEKIVDTVPRTYRIVGICERPALEITSAPGYTAFTVNATEISSYDVLFRSKNPGTISKQITNFLVKRAGREKNSLEKGIDYEIHSNLLRYQGNSSNRREMEAIYSMAVVLILIIMVASVSLIYNAFAISVSERTKQFGLLKSIGATKKQIRHSVYFEALCLCAVGIPVGIISGLAGIGITLHFVGDFFMDSLMNPEMGADVSLRLVVVPEAILIAAAVALITVLVSAMIPAARAVRRTVIESLKESRDVRIRSKNVRSGKFVYYLWGFEGMLANKNFKRNRKKYRLTIFSLSISIILFMVTGCFNGYLRDSVSLAAKETTADIWLNMNNKDMVGISAEDARKQMERVQDVDEAAYSNTVEYAYLVLDEKDVDAEYLSLMKNAEMYKNMLDAGKVYVPVNMRFVDDTSYEKYLKKNHMDVSRFMEGEKLCPIVWDEVYALSDDGTAVGCHVLKKNRLPKEIYCINKIEGYTFVEDYDSMDFNKMEFPFEKELKGGETEQEKFSGKKAVTNISVENAEMTDLDSMKAPLGIGSVNQWSRCVTMIFPGSAIEKLSPKVGMGENTAFYFKADKYKTAYTNISEYLKKASGINKRAVSQLYSEREMQDANRAMLTVMKVFVYGFIILITLIVVANIFNTISTNVQLRRKEFAMLKSVGMSRRGFDKMMNYECMLYGVKSLLIGLPISFVLCYLMSKSLQVAWNAAFSIPWDSVAVVVVGVFAVVFSSMLYSMRKIKRDNPIEALRNDNM